MFRKNIMLNQGFYSFHQFLFSLTGGGPIQLPSIYHNWKNYSRYGQGGGFPARAKPPRLFLFEGANIQEPALAGERGQFIF
jgi:hypothetical protein